MFTGIVAEASPVLSFSRQGDVARLGVHRSESLLLDLKLGASVSVNGVCLTVSGIEEKTIWFDIIASTLSRTNLPFLKKDHLVNIERSLKQNDEMGGHVVSGHVDLVGHIKEIERINGNCRLCIGLENRWMRYLFEHGYVAVNGVSLTVNQVNRVENWFDVWLIPETLRRTNLDVLTVDDAVNIEVPKDQQVQVDTIYQAVSDVLSDWLQRNNLEPEKISTLVDSMKKVQNQLKTGNL